MRADTLKKSKGAPKCSSLNSEGFSWQCWTRAEDQEAGNEPHFRYLRSPAPRAASRGCIGGLRRHWTRGWPSRRVAPSPRGAAADRGRNPGSSPGARPGSAARLPPGPGALLGPSARRAPAGGRVCARTYGRQPVSTVDPRENRITRRPLSKPDTVCADELEFTVKSWHKMLTEKHRLQLDSLKADVNICGPSVKHRAVTGLIGLPGARVTVRIHRR